MVIEIWSKELWKQKFGTEDIFRLKQLNLKLFSLFDLYCFWKFWIKKLFSCVKTRDVNNINAFHRFINYDFWKSVDTLFSLYLPFIWLSVISMILIGLCVLFSFLYWACSNSGLLLDDLLENIFSFFYLKKH